MSEILKIKWTDMTRYDLFDEDMLFYFMHSGK